MIETQSETRTVLARVTDHGPKPRSAAQVLEQAHALFTKEGVWMRNDYFQDGDPEEAFEKSACGSWSACAMGGIGLVSGETPVTVTKSWEERYRGDVRIDWADAVSLGKTNLGLDEWIAENPDRAVYEVYDFDDPWGFDETSTPLCWRAAQFLAAAIDNVAPSAWVNPMDEPVSIVTSYNDRGGMKNRSEVLKRFEEAIVLAKKGKLPTYD